MDLPGVLQSLPGPHEAKQCAVRQKKNLQKPPGKTYQGITEEYESICQKPDLFQCKSRLCVFVFFLLGPKSISVWQKQDLLQGRSGGVPGEAAL